MTMLLWQQTIQYLYFWFWVWLAEKNWHIGKQFVILVSYFIFIFSF